MKKLCLFILIFLLCFTLASCADTDGNKSGIADDPGLSDNTENSDFDNVTADKEFQYPENPQEYVVDYIRSMANIRWTPKTTFQLYGKYQSWSYNLIYKQGGVYFGLPFLVDSRGTRQEFNNSLEDGVYIGGISNSNCIGDACYDAVYVTLIQVCPSISFKSTEDMLPKNETGLLPVGEWDWTISKHDTKTITEAHTLAQMAEAYAELKPGDVVLKHLASQDAGHTRIVSGGPVVYRDNNGNINTQKSYITAIEQTNEWDHTVTINTTWRVDKIYTFAELYETYFVPLTPEDYTNDVSKCYISGDNIIGADEIADAKKLKGELTSNHYITEVSIKIKDKSGNTVYEKNVYPNTKKVYLEDINYTPKLINYQSGTYRFTLEASLSTGTKTIADYDFTLK